MNDLAQGLFGILMTFVVLAGMLALGIGGAFVAAKMIDREPRCSGCGWREGHRMDCEILDRLVESQLAREFQILDRVRSGELSTEQAKKLLGLDQS